MGSKVEYLFQEVFDPLALREADLHDPEAPPAKSPSQPPGQNNFRSAPALTSTGKWPSRLPPPGIEQSPADRE